jgi:hypothetical protein
VERGRNLKTAGRRYRASQGPRRHCSTLPAEQEHRPMGQTRQRWQHCSSPDLGVFLSRPSRRSSRPSRPGWPGAARAAGLPGRPGHGSTLESPLSSLRSTLSSASCSSTSLALQLGLTTRQRSLLSTSASLFLHSGCLPRTMHRGQPRLTPVFSLFQLVMAIDAIVTRNTIQVSSFSLVLPYLCRG